MAKTSQAKKSTDTKGSKIPVSNLSKLSGTLAIQRKPVPDFKKLHTKWEHKLELGKALGKKNITCEEFHFSKSKTKIIGNKENISASSKKDQRLPSSTSDEEAMRSSSKESPNRECLSSLPVSGTEPSIKIVVDTIKKLENPKDVEFKVDERALQSILSNTGVSDQQLLSRTPVKLSEVNVQVPRNSIYNKPSVKSTAYKNMLLSDADNVIPFKTPPSSTNFRIPLRNSVYMSNKLSANKHLFPGRFSMAAKSPGTAARVPSTTKSSSKPAVRWTDILSPEFPVHTSRYTSEENNNINTRLFADDNTPFKSTIKHLDCEMQKLKEIEEVERQLEKEIKQLEERKSFVEKLPASYQKYPQLTTSHCLPCLPQNDLAMCCGAYSTYMPLVPQQTVCSNTHNCCGTELNHITNHLSGIHLNQHPCCSSQCCPQPNMSCHYPSSLELHGTSCSLSSHLVNHPLKQHCCPGTYTMSKHSNCIHTNRNHEVCFLASSNHQPCSVDSGQHDTNLQNNHINEPYKITQSDCLCSSGKTDTVAFNKAISVNCQKRQDNRLQSDMAKDESIKRNTPFSKVSLEDLSETGKNSNDQITTDTFDKHDNKEAHFPPNNRESILLEIPGQIFMPNVLKQSAFSIIEERDVENRAHCHQTMNVNKALNSESIMSSEYSRSRESNLGTLDSKTNVETENFQMYNLSKLKFGRESLFRTPGKSPKSHLGRALINSTTQRFHEALVDEECALYACRLKTKYSPQSIIDRDCENPLARVLTEGDAAHFIPVEEQRTFSKSDTSAFRTYLS